MSSLGPLRPTESVPITEVSVTEVSVETTGVLPTPVRVRSGTILSKAALGIAVGALILAPIFGMGIAPAIVAVIMGHIGRKAAPAGRFRSTIAVGVGYAALMIGTAVLVLVALPLSLAFLMSAGYILEG